MFMAEYYFQSNVFKVAFVGEMQKTRLSEMIPIRFQERFF